MSDEKDEDVFEEPLVVAEDGQEDDAPESETETDAVIDDVEQVVHLLPVHAAPRTSKNPLQVKRGPGRPRKVERAPTVSDLQYHAMILEAKKNAIENDVLVRLIDRHADTADILHSVKREIAKEIAALDFLRNELEKYGKDTAQISARRIDALKKLNDVELEIKRLGATTIDLKSEKMQRVFAYFIEKIQDVARTTLQPEVIDLFFNKLSTELKDWVEECEAMVSK